MTRGLIDDAVERSGSVQPVLDLDLNYTTFMRTASADALIGIVEDRFREWVTSKGIHLDAGGTGSRPDGTGTRTTVRVLEGRNEQLLRGTLVEEHPRTGRWTTEVVASNAGWLHIEVQNDQGRYVAVPKIAKTLMRSGEFHDASLRLRDQVRMWDVSELDQLVELLTSAERNGLILIAGTGPQPDLFHAFNDRLPKWIGDTYGLAQVISLTPQATHGLTRRLEEHGTDPWTIRTYFPGLRLGSSADARRHRFMSIRTLATLQDHRIRRILGTVAREHASHRSLPHEVVAARRAFERAETHKLIDRLARQVDAPSLTSGPEPVPPQQPRENQSGLELVRAFFGISDVSERTLTAALEARVEAARADLAAELEAAAELLDEQQDRTERLEDANRALLDAAEDDELNRAELADELDRSLSEVRWLRSKFTEIQDFDTAFGSAPEGFEPTYANSCEELVRSLADGDIIFTGNLDDVQAVDSRDTFRSCVREATQCINALREYVRAQRDGQAPSGVHHFLSHTPSGYSAVSPGKHAQGETGYTKRHHGHERIFRVPKEVDESGSVQMVAHFKLARIGMASPRLYYYDDCKGTGRIYVGYLGVHLTNSQTN